MKVAIIDYGSGNLHSAHKAFERAAFESGIGGEMIVTSDPELVRTADRVVLPGVGAYADCRRGLDAVSGMVDAMSEAVHGKGRPFLGICVGMQLLADHGLEHVTTPGLSWIDGDVVEIKPQDTSLKIPHMGWNTLDQTQNHALLDGIPTGADGWHAYFVHSFHVQPSTRDTVIATSDYGGKVTALVAKGTVAGTQFHPEKSQKLGLALIANFLRWRP